MMGRVNGFNFSVWRLQGVNANDAKLNHVAHAIVSILQESQDRNVALWGLAFESGTDDRRHSPANHVARPLLDLGMRVKAYDPIVVSGDADDLDGIEIVRDA